MEAKDMRLCRVDKSDKKDKKFDAVFRDKKCPCKANDKPECGRKEKVVSFGAKGMSDFTKNHDPERKKNYLTRHEPNEDWSNPLSAGALSRWILWNKHTLEASIRDFKKRFNM